MQLLGMLSECVYFDHGIQHHNNPTETMKQQTVIIKLTKFIREDKQRVLLNCILNSCSDAWLKTFYKVI